MIDVEKLAAEAASQFGLSLKDDPTAWDTAIDAAGASRLDQVAPAAIVETCQLAAASNALSAVNRALGAASEKIATAMDVAVHEDGPLADLDGVWAAHVVGLAVNTSGVLQAADWQGRVDALRDAIRRAAHTLPQPTISDVLAYMNSDPRFDGLGALKKGVAALDEPFAPPAFLVKGGAEAAKKFLHETGARFAREDLWAAAVARLASADVSSVDDAKALLTDVQAKFADESERTAAACRLAGVATASYFAGVDWEDETGTEHGNSIDGGPVADTWDDAPTAPAPAKGKRKASGKAAPPSHVPGFPSMLNAAGVTKADVARLCGYSESYIGYIFAGRKPWPGLKPEQVKALRDEVELRHAALAEALAVLDSGKLLLPAEV